MSEVCETSYVAAKATRGESDCSILRRDVLEKVSPNTEVGTAPDFNPTKKVVMKVKLSKDLTVHIIKFRNNPYLTSADISTLVRGWKKRDVLAPMLNLKKARFESIEIAREDAEFLFEQCIL